MEYTGVIKAYDSVNHVTIGALILMIPWSMVDLWQERYPVSTRVRVEVQGVHIVSMIDAPVYHPYEQATLTQLYIEQNTQPEPMAASTGKLVFKLEGK